MLRKKGSELACQMRELVVVFPCRELLRLSVPSRGAKPLAGLGRGVRIILPLPNLRNGASALVLH